MSKFRQANIYITGYTCIVLIYNIKKNLVSDSKFRLLNNPTQFFHNQKICVYTYFILGIVRFSNYTIAH